MGGILGGYHFGSVDDECGGGGGDGGGVLGRIEYEVEKNCSFSLIISISVLLAIYVSMLTATLTGQENTLRHWRLGTSLAVDSIMKDELPLIFARIVANVEDRFAQYASSDAERRKRQLLDLLRRCADLKMTLRRQGRYAFTCSSHGEKLFDPESMAYVGGERQDGGRVRFSLWPALLKFDVDLEYRVLEKELVWTML